MPGAHRFLWAGVSWHLSCIFPAHLIRPKILLFAADKREADKKASISGIQ
ncbi:hypothetical protein LMG33818_000847 [Halomonadaceae bacterium LMG 33818]